MKTLNQILQLLTQFADAHLQVASSGSGFKTDLNTFLTNNSNQSVLYFEYLSISNNIRTQDYNIRIYSLDAKQKDNGNSQDILSDTAQILTDVRKYMIDSFEAQSVFTVAEKSVNLTPVNNFTNDWFVGWYMDITISAALIYGDCDIPVGTIPNSPVTPGNLSVTWQQTIDNQYDGGLTMSVNGPGDSFVISDDETTFTISTTDRDLSINIGGDFILKTKSVDGGTASNGQVLTLMDDATGEAEWQDLSLGNTETFVTDDIITPLEGTNFLVVTALAEALQFNIPSGTWADGDELIIRILDDGTARALTFGAGYRPVGVLIPTTTTLSKTQYLGIIYNALDDTFDVVANKLEV